MTKKDFKEGDRIKAPNLKARGEIQAAQIIDVLDVQVFARFDSGDEDFVFKVEIREVLS